MDKKIVIAHRGASGYLPEHTLEGKVLAHYMGADYLEQDIALSKDNYPIVIHDIYLDRLTDVAEKFPNRARQDGRYYVIDFTLEEIKSLNFTEGFIYKNGEKEQEYKDRFPCFKSTFKLHTLDEEIEFIQGINKTLNREAGLYVETKAPWFHKLEGKDISKVVLSVLKKYGYTDKSSKVFFQTFDYNDLKYVHNTLFKEFNMDIKTIMLIAYNSWNETYEIKEDKSLYPFDFEMFFRQEGLHELSKYAYGIGPAYSMIIDERSSVKGKPAFTKLVEYAHKNNLKVHPYTVRNDRLPDYVSNIDELFKYLLIDADVDGIFTDFPDKCVNFLRSK